MLLRKAQRKDLEWRSDKGTPVRSPAVISPTGNTCVLGWALAKPAPEPGPEPRKLLPSLRRPSARSPMSVPRLPRLQLHMAARKGSKRIVLALLAKGAKVSATDYSRNTPLHQAVIGGHARLARRTSEHNGGAVRATPRYASSCE